MQKNSLQLGHFYEALYYEYEPDKTLWGDGEIGNNGYKEIGVPFRYKQQDASRQGVGFVGDENDTYQSIQGYKQNRRNYRIVTNDNLPFKTNDKIIRKTDNQVFMIRRIVKDKTVTNSLISLQFPSAEYYQPTVLDMTG